MRVTDLRSRYGMHATPFTKEGCDENRFDTDFFKQVIQAIVDSVEQGLCASLISAAGTGKTSVLRAVIQQLPEARYSVSTIKVCGLSKREFCRELSSALGCSSAGTYPVLLRTLQAHLESIRSSDGLRPVIVIDEAHDLRPEVIGVLRLLTNFDMDSRLVVSFVLAGQPKLAAQLKRPELEDVARRINHYASLRLLSQEESRRYIQHRCFVAGSKDAPFDTSALDAVYEIGRGNLRATDNLCLKSLECAHHQDCDMVSLNHVVEARKLLWP